MYLRQYFSAFIPPFFICDKSILDLFHCALGCSLSLLLVAQCPFRQLAFTYAMDKLGGVGADNIARAFVLSPSPSPVHASGGALEAKDLHMTNWKECTGVNSIKSGGLLPQGKLSNWAPSSFFSETRNRVPAFP